MQIPRKSGIPPTADAEAANGLVFQEEKTPRRSIGSEKRSFEVIPQKTKEQTQRFVHTNPANLAEGAASRQAEIRSR